MTDTTGTGTGTGYRPLYAMAVPGPRLSRVVLTAGFYARYGYVLGRPPAPPAERPRVRPGTVAGWVREARERKARAEAGLAKGGHAARKVAWQPPMTGEALTQRREALDLSQRQLAEAAHVSRGVLSALEAGTRRSSPATWRALVAALAAAAAEPKARR